MKGACLSSTPDKLQRKWGTYSAQLNTVKTNYEASGNGEGGRTVGQSNECCSITDEKIEYGGYGAKRDFLRGYSTHILYLWEMATKYNFLPAVLQRIDSSLNYDGGPPSIAKRMGT